MKKLIDHVQLKEMEKGEIEWERKSIFRRYFFQEGLKLILPKLVQFAWDSSSLSISLIFFFPLAVEYK